MGRLRFVVSFVAALATVLPACSAVHTATSVESGIYDLTVRGEADACSPARATGTMGEVGVAAAPGALSLPVPGAMESDSFRISLASRDGWHGEMVEALEGCDGGRLARSWTVLESADGALTVGYHEVWSGVAGCTDAMRALSPSVPAIDCEADLVLDYQLREACAAPCELGVSVAGLSCVCG